MDNTLCDGYPSARSKMPSSIDECRWNRFTGPAAAAAAASCVTSSNDAEDV